MSAYWPDMPCKCDAYAGTPLLVPNNTELPNAAEFDLIVSIGDVVYIRIHVKTGSEGQILQ